MSTFRLSCDNEWRFNKSRPKKRLSLHLNYLVNVFQDALTTKKNSIDVNADFHCSPLRFYGNGIAIKDVDSDEIKCWKGLFDSESEFLTAHQLLRESFKKCSMKKNENRFERNISFLTDVIKSL